MERSHDEIDFFRMKRVTRRNLVPSVVSKISPQLLKTVMASGEARDVDSRRQGNSTSDSTGLPDLSTLTIFYNGTVTAVNIPHDKSLYGLSSTTAHFVVISGGAVIKMVESLTAKRSDGPPKGTPANGNRLGSIILVLSISRSAYHEEQVLYRFLEKRKERLASSSPYRKPITTTDSC
ncbi:unnamed protein product [Spirodela intermedia]|uniref:Uncharacterized protein n=1 Tax=Spirodela intermedia TaxID=51605 RepID=A0A7I8J1I5_SPIIN|nr:unnamed protein product [Spirodela intermedia]CAA6663997.1 unnamed protein product [Spirodela intermedia]